MPEQRAELRQWYREKLRQWYRENPDRARHILGKEGASKMLADPKQQKRKSKAKPMKVKEPRDLATKRIVRKVPHFKQRRQASPTPLSVTSGSLQAASNILGQSNPIAGLAVLLSRSGLGGMSAGLGG
jgi:hypothetical protein